MIDHVTLYVRDIQSALAFYTAALAPIGYAVVMEFPGAAGLGAGGKPDLWLAQNAALTPTHIALAGSRADVDAFHRAALGAGGKDNGAPGPRPHYHPNYYGAFVHDADGNNIEVVCHAPVGAKKAATKGASRKAAAKKAPAKKAAKKVARKATKPGVKKAAKRRV